MSRPQVKQDGFAQAKSMQDKIDTLERVVRGLLNSTNNPAIQPGVDGPNDIQQAGSGVNSSTLVLSAVWAIGGTAWVRDAGGQLIRVPFPVQTTQHQVPAIVSGQFIGVGCDVTSDGTMVSTNRIGTPQATLAAAQTQLNVRPGPTANPGYLPIVDFFLTNTTGTYSFVAVRDRRTFARGFHKAIIWTPATAPSTTLGTVGSIDGSPTNPSPGSFSLRVECSGASSFMNYYNASRWFMPAGGSLWGFMIDGNNQINGGLYNGGADHDRPLTIMAPMSPGVTGGLVAGSRLFQPAWQSGTAGQVTSFSGPFGIFWEVREVIGGETSNGTG